MPRIQFTAAQDKALFASIVALPAQRLLAAILFALIYQRQDRDRLVQTLTGL